jgi:glycosyltransferase involved in cell wall biosynthesis
VTHDIMLPFYGRPDHFRLAVESVLAQDDPDWRLVVIDDHYPDPAPGEWVRSLGDDRIEYVRHAENRGINAAFQECVERSTHDWVTIFGGDDLMRPGYVSRVRALAETHPRAAMIHPGVGIVDGDGAPATTLVDTAKAFYRPRGKGVVELSGEDLAVSVTRGNWMNFPAVAWNGPELRRIGFRAGFEVVQDLALVLDLCEAGGSLVVDDEVVFDYRRHAGSVSSWKAVDGSRFVEEQDFFRSLVPRFRSIGWNRAARAARIHLSSRLNALTRLPGALSARDGSGSAVLVAHAIGVSPRRSR